MKILTDDDADNDPRIDFDDCPYCEATIGELADDVRDDDYRDESKDVAGIECPACHKRLALVRSHSYRLAKFRDTNP